MKNWLIRLLGGITPDEFAQLVKSYEVRIEEWKSSYASLMEVHNQLLEIYNKTSEERKELQELILKRTGFIREQQVPSVQQILNPIQTRPKNWLERKREFERKDSVELEERWRKKDPNAKLNSEILEELNEEAQDASEVG